MLAKLACLTDAQEMWGHGYLSPRPQEHPSTASASLVYSGSVPIPVRACDQFVPAFLDIGLIFLSPMDSLDPLWVGPELAEGFAEDNPGLV